MLRRAVEDLRAEVGSRRRRCLEALSVPADAIVVNVAAQRYDADKFETAQSDMLTGNAEIANRLYRFCLTKGIREVRAASSVAVYPAACDPLDDARPVDLNAPPNPNEAFYAWSKRWSEVVADLHAERYGIHTISFRLSNPYGPPRLEGSAQGACPAGLRDARAGPGRALHDQGQPAGRARLHLRRRRRRRVRSVARDPGDERRAQPLPRREPRPCSTSPAPSWRWRERTGPSTPPTRRPTASSPAVRPTAAA